MLFEGELSPDLAILRAGAFIVAHPEVNRQRLWFPWQLPQMQGLLRSRRCPFTGSLPSPSVAGMEKVQGMKHRSRQEQTAFGIAFHKADGLQSSFSAADKQADVGGFICVSWNGQMELGIWRDFWYFLLPVSLNILEGDLYLDILTLPLLILMWKTKQRDSWKCEVKKKKVLVLLFSISGKGTWSLRGLAVQPGYYFIPYKSRALSLCSVKLSSPPAFFFIENVKSLHFKFLLEHHRSLAIKNVLLENLMLSVKIPVSMKQSQQNFWPFKAFAFNHKSFFPRQIPGEPSVVSMTFR